MAQRLIVLLHYNEALEKLLNDLDKQGASMERITHYIVKSLVNLQITVRWELDERAFEKPHLEVELRLLETDRDITEARRDLHKFFEGLLHLWLRINGWSEKITDMQKPQTEVFFK